MKPLRLDYQDRLEKSKAALTSIWGHLKTTEEELAEARRDLLGPTARETLLQGDRISAKNHVSGAQEQLGALGKTAKDVNKRIKSIVDLLDSVETCIPVHYEDVLGGTQVKLPFGAGDLQASIKKAVDNRVAARNAGVDPDAQRPEDAKPAPPAEPLSPEQKERLKTLYPKSAWLRNDGRVKREVRYIPSPMVLTNEEIAVLDEIPAHEVLSVWHGKGVTYFEKELTAASEVEAQKARAPAKPEPKRGRGRAAKASPKEPQAEDLDADAGADSEEA